MVLLYTARKHCISSIQILMYTCNTYFFKDSSFCRRLDEQQRSSMTNDNYQIQLKTHQSPKQSPSCRPQQLLNHCSDKTISQYENHLRKVSFNVVTSSFTRLQVVFRLLCNQYHWLHVIFIVNLILSRLVCYQYSQHVGST